MSSNAETSSKSRPSSGAKSLPKARKTSSIPAKTVDYLKAWMMSPEHVAHPYPTEQEKVQIMTDTGIELKQLTNWFVNNRKRFWKPRIEARLQKKQVKASSRATSTPGERNAIFTAHSAKPRLCVTLDATPRNFVATHSNDDPHTVSVGSTSSLSSESDNNSFGDDDDAVFSGSKHKIQIIDREGIVKFKRARCVTMDSDEDQYILSPKRPRTSESASDLIPDDTPRPDFLSKDTEKWRDVCRNATSGFELSLPTLEEAAHMFGYTD